MASILKVDQWQTSDGTVVASSDANGYINYPEKPIISGRMGSIASLTTAQIIPFDEFFVQRGITYNSTTRRFTVPTAGIYRVTMDIFWNAGVAGGRVLVGVNTDTPTPANNKGHAYHGGTVHEGASINTVIALNANDYIAYYLNSNGLYNGNSDRFNTFSIELIA